MSFVTIKTPDQTDLLALDRVALAPGQSAHGRDGADPGSLLERGITVRQGLAPLRQALPGILGSSSEALSPRMVRLIGDLAEDSLPLDERIAKGLRRD